MEIARGLCGKYWGATVFPPVPGAVSSITKAEAKAR
jgi:hypothetical protein